MLSSFFSKYCVYLIFRTLSSIASMSCSAFWRTASAGGFRVTTPFIYPCLSPLKCHQDIVLWILINCGWLQEASAELGGLTSEFPGVAAAGAAWCHMEAHAAPPPHKLHIRCCVLFSHSTFMLFSSPAQPLLCRSQSLLCMFRVDIYLLIYVKRTCQPARSGEKLECHPPTSDLC